MSVSDLSAGQRRVVLLLFLGVVAVLALTAGFVVTSMRGLERATATAPSPFSSPPTPFATPSPSPPAPVISAEGPWSQVQAARLFDQIGRQVEALRGLSPRAEVPLNFLDGREMAALLDQLNVERGLEGQLEPYAALGLLPDAPVALEAHEAAAIYVFEQDQLYAVIHEQQGGIDDQVLLAHAYAHALQDQTFDLEAVGARAATTDAALAGRALVEGDATLLTALYRYGDVGAADWEYLASLILLAERPSYGEVLDSSEVWTRLERFPYWEGRRFAAALFEAGGWDAVDRAYTNPPRSSEQVLHPERYLGEPDAPTGVGLPNLGGVLGEGWSLLLEDTLGEFAVGLYLDQTLPEEAAWQAADGWDGDTFVVWEREDGARVRVWRIIWDTTAEAAEFEQAMITLIPQRFLPASPVEAPAGVEGRWWETEGGGVAISRVARYVTLVYAPDLDVLGGVVRALP
ncbi:MAG: hypothetical protein JXD18_14115 [Anaerolineae bacterium]|nr:hypothetical protein [Anaerolineae bacterium]